MNASKLAEENKLSRKINSVRKDKNEVIITVDVSERISEDWYRTETYYYFFNNPDMNEAVAASLEKATLEFLGGLSEEVKAMPDEVIQEAPIAEEKPKKKVRKKAAAKKAAAKKEEEKAEVVAEAAPDLAKDDLDAFGEEETATPEPEHNIIFNKADRDHAAQLSAMIAEKLPAEWKKDADCKAKVRALIAELDGKVAVMNSKGEVLESFNTKCREALS